MKLFEVYPLLPVSIEKASGAQLWDEQGNVYWDLYGGHAVISIGHSHPRYIQRISEQLQKIGFYSNSIHIPLQTEYAERLGQACGLPDYRLFLCNSGAEANENALKLASFATGRSGMVAFSGGFHGRTSAAVALTDNPRIQAPCNRREDFHILPFGEIDPLHALLKTETIAAVIIEGIQGVGGIQLPDPEFLRELQRLCQKFGTKLILDEVQSGFGRTGKFFAYQWTDGIQPDIISMAKGMGNGFPMGGILIAPEFEASYGLLGTTFGGNHLACAAGLAVLEVIEEENLLDRADELGKKLMQKLATIPQLTDVRGKGLMVGLDLDREAAPVRSELLTQHRIFTGSSSNKQTIRILPPLSVDWNPLNSFSEVLQSVLNRELSPL